MQCRSGVMSLPTIRRTYKVLVLCSAALPTASCQHSLTTAFSGGDLCSMRCTDSLVTPTHPCRNRQMTAFYRVVRWFQPGFVLMENVVGILQKEDGIYAKSAMGSLLQMGYQVRMGIVAAYDQGAPQARNR